MARPRKQSRVVSLRGAAIPLPQVNADVVEEIERLLDAARSGNVVGFLYGRVSPEGHVGTGWAGNGNMHHMIAAAAILSHRIMKASTDDG